MAFFLLMNTKSYTYSLEDLPKIIPEIWEIIKDEKFILLEGEMGAGKTTLIAHLAQYLNIDGAVQSPTYALINEYHYYPKKGATQTWIHSDWYRIEDEGEALDTGFEEMLDEHNTKHFIEWFQRIPSLIPKNAILVSLDKINEQTRKITFTKK